MKFSINPLSGSALCVVLHKEDRSLELLLLAQTLLGFVFPYMVAVILLLQCDGTEEVTLLSVSNRRLGFDE